MKVLITGVTGQDGSLLTDYLLSNYSDITVFGGIRRSSNPNYININHLENNPNFIKVEMDVTDYESVTSTIRQIQPDYYINLAANSFVGSSWKMPINHFETNCMGVLYALEAIKNFSPTTRFYNAGSSEQFGDVLYSPQDLNHPFRPRSPYGASKCSAHHLVKVYRDSYNIFAVQGILFNHEGVRRGEEFVTRKITKKVAKIKKCLDIKSKFDPLQLGNIYARRDWGDAEDFVVGIWSMLNTKNPVDYILSSGEHHTIKEFVDEAFKCIGIPGKWQGNGQYEKYILLEDETIVLVEINQDLYRPAEVDTLIGDNSKAIENLGWRVKTNFTQLVRKMVINDYENIK